jgi:hypothetical protein
MDRYEYIIDTISMYIDGYTKMMVSMNIDSISLIANTLGGSFFAPFLKGYFLTIGLIRQGEIELEYSVLTRNSRTIRSSSNVVLMCKRG